MANKKAKISDTLKTEKTFSVFLDSGEIVSVKATTSAEAVKKATTKEQTNE